MRVPANDRFFAPPVPRDPFTRFTPALRLGLQEFITANDRLCLGKRPVGLGSNPRVLPERELSPRSGEMCRFDSESDQTTAYPRSDPIDPCPELPSDPIGDGSIIERIGTQPCP
jgi:hypothetical protein